MVMSTRLQEMTHAKHLHFSGQIIATSAEVTPNGGLVRKSSPKSRKHSGLGIIVICPEFKKIKKLPNISKRERIPWVHSSVFPHQLC